MATVVDALLVTLGLDSKQFDEGRKKTSEGLKQTTSEATKAAKEMEARGAQAAQFYSKIKNELLGLFAVFTAGKGLKEFVSQTTAANAATGRMARNLGMSVDTFTAWQGVVERSGGTAEGFSSSVKGLADQFAAFQITGEAGPALAFLRSLGVQIKQTADGAVDMADLLPKLADKLSAMTPQQAGVYGRGLGFDQGTINTLMQGRKAIEAMLVEQERIGHANKADTDAAIARAAAFKRLGQESENLGTKLLTRLTPFLLSTLRALDRLAEWAKDHPDLFDAVAASALAFGALISGALFLNTIKSILGMTGAVNGLTGAFGALGVVAKVGLVGAAGALGYAAGTQLYNRFIAGTKFGDVIGSGVAKTLAFFGNKEAQEAVDRMEGRGSGSSSTRASASNGAYKPILDLIGKTEGTDKGRGYNETLGYGAYTGGDRNLTEMSLKRIDELQSSMLMNPANTQHSSAVGRYQITRTTLRDLMKSEGLTGDELFTPEMQDRLAVSLIKSRAKGTATSVQNGLAGIWASIPRADTGVSAYGQRTGGTSAQVQAAILASNSLPVGARATAGAGRGSINNSRSSTDITIEQITVQTNATDANGIAKSLGPAIKSNGLVSQANTGLA